MPRWVTARGVGSLVGGLSAGLPIPPTWGRLTSRCQTGPPGSTEHASRSLSAYEEGVREKVNTLGTRAPRSAQRKGCMIAPRMLAPFVIFCTCLPLERPYDLGEWRLLPLAAFPQGRGPIRSSSVSRSCSSQVRRRRWKHLTAPSLIVHGDRGGDGLAPDERQYASLRAAIHYATRRAARDSSHSVPAFDEPSDSSGADLDPCPVRPRRVVPAPAPRSSSTLPHRRTCEREHVVE